MTGCLCFGSVYEWLPVLGGCVYDWLPVLCLGV